MLDLVLDCGLFICVQAGRGNLFQVSGKTPPPWSLSLTCSAYNTLRDAIDYTRSQIGANPIGDFNEAPALKQC